MMIAARGRILAKTPYTLRGVVFGGPIPSCNKYIASVSSLGDILIFCFREESAFFYVLECFKGIRGVCRPVVVRHTA